MLSSIRKAYLNVDTSTSNFSRQAPRSLGLDSSEQHWSSIRFLTNEERDQIDLQARIILSKCADRVRELEALEKSTFTLASRKVVGTLSLYRKNGQNFHRKNPISSCASYLRG